MVIGFKIILVRQFDDEKQEIFYSVYYGGRKHEFKEKQIVASAYAKKLDDENHEPIRKKPDTLEVGDVVYVNQMGWMEVIK